LPDVIRVKQLRDIDHALKLISMLRSTQLKQRHDQSHVLY